MINGAWIMVTSCKRQASSPKRFKLQAAGVKPQAASFKLQASFCQITDRGSLIKFYDARTEGLDADEAIVRMRYMIGNLVW